MEKILGIEWNTINAENQKLGMIKKLTHKDFGDVYITHYVLDTDLFDLKESEYYVFTTILREKHLQGKTVLICQENKEEVFDFMRGNISPLSVSDIRNSYPKSIGDKQKRVLSNLALIQPEYGKYIEELNYYDCFAKDNYELNFLMKLLEEKDMIENGLSLSGNGTTYMRDGVLLKEKAWIELEKNEQMHDSNQAFVAMWFDPKMDCVFEAINKACKSNGFTAFRIDTKQHNNEISGEILVEIRKSRFLISEVTGQRQGVYFEAGYALAFGLQVIWCCKKDELDKVHFDTRQYNHVVWTDEDDLTNKLEKRIKGTIIK